MMTVEQIRAALADRNVQAVARESGVSANAIYRLANNPDAQPLWITVKRLSDYLESRQ